MQNLTSIPDHSNPLEDAVPEKVGEIIPAALVSEPASWQPVTPDMETVLVDSSHTARHVFSARTIVFSFMDADPSL